MNSEKNGSLSPSAVTTAECVASAQRSEDTLRLRRRGVEPILQIPRALVKRIRRGSSKLRRGVDLILVKTASRSGLLSALYYAFWSARFRREQRAFLNGRLRYATDAIDPQQSSAVLRRGIHRLEKGLISRPRREVFALDYIVETVHCYERIIGKPDSCIDLSRDELKWACDVLSDYFDVVGPHPKIDPLRDRFHSVPPLGDDSTNGRFVPYKRDLSSPPSVGYDDLLKLAHRRRSVRWFQQKPVPREAIQKAVAVAAQSPSACNRQPFVFRVFDDPELVRQVAALPAGTSGFCHNFPAVVVLVGQDRHYFDERDRHVIYIDASLAAMAFVYALETLSLSSCCVNWPDVEEREREMEKVLRLEPDERPVMLIAVGFPDESGLVPYSAKKRVEQLCKFNFEETTDGPDEKCEGAAKRRKT